MTKRIIDQNPSANTLKRHHGGGDGDDFIPMGYKRRSTPRSTLTAPVSWGNGTRHAKSSFGFVLVR